MWTEDDIEVAVSAFPAEAADALEACQLGADGHLLTAAGLKAAAAALGHPQGHFWVAMLKSSNLLPAFAAALHARDVPIDLGEPPIDTTHMSFEATKRFADQASGFRCQVYRDGVFSGSGVLIGPSTVLTAWHVIGPTLNYAPTGPYPSISVQLSDGRRLRAMISDNSPCSKCEFEQFLPANDNEVTDFHDVALLQLEAPAGAQLGFASLVDAPPNHSPKTPLFLVHYPAGADLGIGFGATEKIPLLTSRIGHTILTQSGSSGGGCFDTKAKLIGVHQGKRPNNERGRYVPIGRFLTMAKTRIAADIAPPEMWSIDGTAKADLVIGRRDFFRAYAAALAPGPVRGIRVKRSDARADSSGMGFSYQILAGLVARVSDQRLCRITINDHASDFGAETIRRIRDLGLAVDDLEIRAGVAPGESAPEAVGADRGKQAADLADRAAERANVQLWLFIDPEPEIGFDDEQRACLEGFVERALLNKRLRLVIAGYEAAPLPGFEYDSGFIPADGPVGFMTDYLTDFRRADVEELLRLASKAAGKELISDQREAFVAESLGGLNDVNGRYAIWQARIVAAALKPNIEAMFSGEENG